MNYSGPNAYMYCIKDTTREEEEAAFIQTGRANPSRKGKNEKKK